MEVILELGSYAFRAKFVDEQGKKREKSIPAEVYISKNGLKFGENIQYNTFPEEKLKNVVIDPITILGRKFNSERVLTHAANVNYDLVPTSRNEVQIALRDISGEYYADDIVAILIERLMNVVRKCLKNVGTIKLQYPIKYTTTMLNAYEGVLKQAKLRAIPLSIEEILPLQNPHLGENILFLDIGHKLTRIYVLQIGEEPPFTHKILDEHEFNYGGSQFDMLLFNHFMTKMNKTDYTSLEEVIIMKLCDKLKKRLSISAETVFVYEDYSSSITRQEFEKMIRRFVYSILEKYKSLCYEHGVNYYFERGGCTQIPYIRALLKQ